MAITKPVAVVVNVSIANLVKKPPASYEINYLYRILVHKYKTKYRVRFTTIFVV